MKLPKRSSSTSRSMSGAFRKPITRGAAKQHVAAQQRHYGMPTNYDELGKAQARAAIAQGEVGMAWADAGIKAGNAVLAVDLVNQNAEYASKESKLRSWVAGYYAEQSQRQDLTQKNGDGRYVYETLNEDFERKSRMYMRELDAEHQFTDAELKSKYAATRSGILSTVGVKIDGLASDAKIARIKGDGDEQYNKISTKDDWENFKNAFGMYYSEQEMEKKRVDAQDKYNSFAIDAELEASGSNREIRDEIMAKIDAMEANQSLTRTAANSRRTAANRHMSANRSAMMSAMTVAESVAELEALEAQAYADQTWDDDTATRVKQRNVSRVVTQDIIWPLHVDGEFTDSDVLLSEANTALETERLNGNVNPTDYNRTKTILMDGAKNAASESLKALYAGDPANISGDIGRALMDLEDASPEQYGFAPNDPNWDDFKKWYTSEANRYLSAHNKTITEAGKDIAIAQSAMAVRNGATLNPGSDNYTEIMEAAWSGSLGATQGYPGAKSVAETKDEFISRHRYVPQQIADNVAASIASDDGMAKHAGVREANRINKLTNYTLLVDGEGLTGFQRKQFELAAEFEARSSGMDPTSDSYAQQWDNLVNSKNKAPSLDQKAIDSQVSAFGENKNQSGTWQQFYADNQPDGWPDMDDMQGQDVFKSIMTEYYRFGLEAGKDHEVAMQQAMGAAMTKIGIELTADGKPRFVNNSIYAMHNWGRGQQHQEGAIKESFNFDDDPRILQRSLEQYAEGNAWLTPEEIQNGWQISDASKLNMDQVRLRYDPKAKGWWMVEATSGRPIVHTKVGPSGEYSTTGAVFIKHDELAPSIQAEVDVKNASKAAEASMKTVVVNKQQLEQELEIAKRNNAEAGRPTRVRPHPSRGEIKEMTAEQIAANESNDPAVREIAEQAAIIRELADVRGESEDWVRGKIEEMKVGVISAYEQQQNDPAQKMEPDQFGRLNYGQHSNWDELNRESDESYYGTSDPDLFEDIKALGQAIEDAFSRADNPTPAKRGSTRGAGPNAPETKRKSNKSGFAGRGGRNSRKKSN